MSTHQDNIEVKAYGAPKPDVQTSQWGNKHEVEVKPYPNQPAPKEVVIKQTIKAEPTNLPVEVHHERRPRFDTEDLKEELRQRLNPEELRRMMDPEELKKNPVVATLVGVTIALLVLFIVSNLHPITWFYKAKTKASHIMPDFRHRHDQQVEQYHAWEEDDHRDDSHLYDRRRDYTRHEDEEWDQDYEERESISRRRPQLVRQASRRASDLYDYARDKASQVYRGIRRPFYRGRDAVEETFDNARDRASDAYDYVKDSAREILPETRRQSRDSDREYFRDRDYSRNSECKNFEYGTCRNEAECKSRGYECENKEWAHTKLNKASNKASRFADDARYQAESTGDRVYNKARQGSRAANNAYEDAKDSASEYADEAKYQVESAGNRVVQTVREVPRAASDMLETAKQRANDLYEAAKHTVQYPVRRVRETTEDAVDSAHRAGEQTYQNARDAATRTQDAARDAAYKTSDTARDVAQKTAQAARDAASATGDALSATGEVAGNTLTAAKNIASNKLHGMADSVKNAAQTTKHYERDAEYDDRRYRYHDNTRPKAEIHVDIREVQ